MGSTLFPYRAIFPEILLHLLQRRFSAGFRVTFGVTGLLHLLHGHAKLPFFGH